jgi:hypothetical protein
LIEFFQHAPERIRPHRLTRRVHKDGASKSFEFCSSRTASGARFEMRRHDKRRAGAERTCGVAQHALVARVPLERHI